MSVNMLSPALRHQQRVVSQRAAGHTDFGQVTRGSLYELQLYKLAEDKRRLKTIQSLQKKIALKAQLLPDYAPWVDGVLTSGKGAHDDVFTTLLVWHIDVGDYARAIDMANYALQHKMTLPDQYNRDLPTLLMDEFASAYLHGQLANHPLQAVCWLDTIYKLTQEHDAPDQAKAKLLKALGYAEQTVACVLDEPVGCTNESIQLAQSAYIHLTQAVQLFHGVGVKKDIDKLERWLKKAAAVIETSAPTAHGGADE